MGARSKGEARVRRGILVCTACCAVGEGAVLGSAAAVAALQYTLGPSGVYAPLGGAEPAHARAHTDTRQGARGAGGEGGSE